MEKTVTYTASGFPHPHVEASYLICGHDSMDLNFLAFNNKLVVTSNNCQHLNLDVHKQGSHIGKDRTKVVF